MHYLFRPDGTCALVVVPFPAVPNRAVSDAAGPSCSYQTTGRDTVITLTRPDGTVDHAIAVLRPDDALVIRRQPSTFVPFVARGRF